MPVILSPSQESALESFRDFLTDPEQREFLISGFAGSGKSFLVKHLVNVVEHEFRVARVIDPEASMPTLYFAATTNKAAGVLSAMLNKPAGTIHRLLGLSVQTNYKTGVKSLVEKNDPKDLAGSVVFVDEASMVTRDLMDHIRKAAKKFKQCKVIYIGDNYQLPPVKESLCPVFHTVMTTNFLTEIQRQVAGSPIIQLASQYRMMLDDHTLEWPTIVHDNHTIFHYQDKQDWFNAVQAAYLPIHGVDDVKVLAWTNDRVREYNAWIRNFSGQTGDFAIGETVQTNRPIQKNDKILAPTDSSHLIRSITETRIDDIDGYHIGLESLSTRVLQMVFQPKSWKAANKLAAGFAKNKNWKAFYQIKDEWADLRAVHAQTVHKSQGSTYRDVFIDLSNIGRNNKWQEVARLVYVGITRASNQVHLFGQLQDRYTKKPVVNRMEVFKNAANSAA
jgi:exodeoxyribonuclease-5